MKHHVIQDTPAAVVVLNIDPSEIPPFVRKCVRDRSLSTLIKQLNNDVAFGNAAQKEVARRALHHIGFL